MARAATTIGKGRKGQVKHHPANIFHGWALVALVLVVLGSGGSFVGAVALTNSANTKIHKAFLASAQEIASTVHLSLQDQQDLITSTESFLIGNPDATLSEFTKWSEAVDVLGHNPGLTGLGILSIIPASQLAEYSRSESAATGKPFHVTPAGTRPFYCLAPMGIYRPGTLRFPNNVDLCTTTFKSLITTARSTGKSELIPYDLGGTPTIAFESPYYTGGDVPRTAAARVAHFAQIIALTLEPSVMLHDALIGHADTALALQYGNSSNLIFRNGTAPKGYETAQVVLHDGWTVKVFGEGTGGSLTSNVDALFILLGGIALSLVLGALIFELGTGRARLMLLVDERTEQLHFQATHDALTGLPNRTLIVDRIDQLLHRNRRQGTLGAALFVDLDDFKNVNDSLGHEAGDRLLVLVAERMKSAIREADTIGRMGGDEFVVLVDGGEQADAPDHVAQRLLDVMRKPFELDGSLLPLIVNTSIGIAVGDRSSGSEFLRDADVALYQAKSKGKNKYVFFNPRMEEAIRRRIALEFDLRAALTDDQFRLLYQPIYNLEDLTMVGVEALLRWDHPVEGLLHPDEFVPILERTGQIRRVGAWVLQSACRQMAAWHAQGDTLDLSVNVSGRQFDDDLLGEQIRGALDESGLSGHSLVVEVTETALMLDVDSVVRQLQSLKELGVRVAIDDFGTGYSSLSSLRQFPVDCIKIDQSFISTMDTSDESKALVRTFIQLGRDLGLETLAEGVETIEQMDVLREAEVTLVQGFLFSHPLDAELVERQLLEPRRGAAKNSSATE